MKKNQQGIVAIIVTMILMIVLAVIVLSFSKISQRAERDAADRQLSTQAFYAAESGINIAKEKLINTPALHGTYTTNCDAFITAAGITTTAEGNIEIGDANSNSVVTCLFVDSAPPSLEYTKTTSQVVFPYDPVFTPPPSAPTTMKIAWDDGESTTSYSSGTCVAPNNHPVNSSCAAPVLRVEIANLLTSKVFFAYPGSSDGAPSYASATGTATTGTCTAGATPKECSITISGVPAGSYVRIKPIYTSMALTITENAGKKLKGGQAVIDATGRAADVERRIQVRMPLDNFPHPPDLIADKICKKFIIDGTNAIDQGSCWSGGTPD